MKILLIYPEFPDTFWSFKHALKFIRKKAGAPPLGLLTVAAMLPFDWEKRLVDLNVGRLSDEDLAWADAVFLSAMIVQGDSAREIIQRCKAVGVKVVAGDPLFTMEYDQFPEVDQFVLNEAEETLKPFLREYKPPSVQAPLEPQYLLALLRSIYQLGILGVERVHYWRLFFWTLFRRPRLFPLAVTLAICGFHFRRVIELHVG